MMHGAGQDPKKCPFMFPQATSPKESVSSSSVSAKKYIYLAAAVVVGALAWWLGWTGEDSWDIAEAHVAHIRGLMSNLGALLLRWSAEGWQHGVRLGWRGILKVGVGALMGTVVACRLGFAILRVLSRSAAGLQDGGAAAATVTTLGLFHPYCSSGGGGERVLWMALRALGEIRAVQEGRIKLVVYTGDDGLSKSEILRQAEERFQIALPTAVTSVLHFETIWTRGWLEGKRYPRLTMLCQSLASMLVGLECLLRYPPDIFFDTTGAPFTYVVAKVLAGCTVAAYVHYPIISADMLARVVEQRPAYNNDERIAQSITVSHIKLVYYHAMALLYQAMGWCVRCTMVNSSWTKGHIEHMWGKSAANVHLVYPPCGNFTREHITEQARARKQHGSIRPRERLILSLGQFRPEKDHRLQIEAFAALKARDPKFGDVRMLMLGSTRGRDDEALLSSLKQYAQAKGVDGSIGFFVNRPYAELQRWMSRACVGVHTMWNEHFGISVVEMLYAGMVVVAHDSGGPKMDILKDQKQNRAQTPSEYALAMATALEHNGGAHSEVQMQENQASCLRFSDSAFRDQFCSLVESELLP